MDGNLPPYRRPKGMWKAQMVVRVKQRIQRMPRWRQLTVYGISGVLLASLVVGVSTAAADAVIIPKGLDYVVGTWQLTGVSAIEDVFGVNPNTGQVSGSETNLASVGIDQLKILVGEYIEIDKSGTYISSASRRQLDWSYSDGSFTFRGLDGGVDIVDEDYLRNLVSGKDELAIPRGNAILKYERVPSGQAEQLKKEGTLEPVKYSTAKTRAGGADLIEVVDAQQAELMSYTENTTVTTRMEQDDSIVELSTLVPENVWQEYTLLSSTGQQSFLFLQSDNVFTLITGVESQALSQEFDIQLTTDENMADDLAGNRQKIRDYNASLKLVSPVVTIGRWELTDSGLALIEEDGTIEQLSTNGQYLYTAPLTGSVMYEKDSVNPFEDNGYVLDTDLSSIDTGVDYLFHMDGSAEVVSYGATVEYQYAIDSDGLIQLVPKGVLGQGTIADYMYFEKMHNTVYRAVYQRSTWSDFVDSSRAISLPLCTTEGEVSLVTGDIVADLLALDEENYNSIRISIEDAISQREAEQALEKQQKEKDAIAKAEREMRLNQIAKEEAELVEAQKLRGEAWETAQTETSKESGEPSTNEGESGLFDPQGKGAEITDGVEGASTGTVVLNGNRNPYTIKPVDGTVFKVP